MHSVKESFHLSGRGSEGKPDISRSLERTGVFSEAAVDFFFCRYEGETLLTITKKD
jgi:hypothetical protein